MKTLVTITITILLLFSCTISRAQEAIPCVATPSQSHVNTWKDNNSIFNKRLQFVKTLSIDNLKSVERIKLQNNNFNLIQMPPQNGPNRGELLGATRIIPIAAHIVRRSNGTGGLSETDLQASVDRANIRYAALNMNFVINEIRFIDSNQKYNKSYKLDKVVEVQKTMCL